MERGGRGGAARRGGSRPEPLSLRRRVRLLDRSVPRQSHYRRQGAVEQDAKTQQPTGRRFGEWRPKSKNGIATSNARDSSNRLAPWAIIWSRSQAPMPMPPPADRADRPDRTERKTGTSAPVCPFDSVWESVSARLSAAVAIHPAIRGHPHGGPIAVTIAQGDGAHAR